MLETVKNEGDLESLKSRAIAVNTVLQDLFKNAGIKLVDFKLEFGYSPDGEIVLGDEISPDSCRLWDAETDEKMDKDRFRRDLGDVIENYQEVLNRLQKNK
jgi:phosphoribosylaminoimidazole-succinocarboxamide synthase